MIYESNAAMKKAHQEEVNRFPFGFAFGSKQFAEMMQGWGLNAESKEDLQKIVSIGAGGYVRKEDVPDMEEMFARQKREQQEFRKRGKDLFAMFCDALCDHEYIVTGDVMESLDALGISVEELNKSEQMKKALAKAIKWCDENCSA